MKVSDLPQKAPKVLLYGPVGTGKTALALTLGARAQVMDMDDGLMTGRTLEDKWSAERRAVDVEQFLESQPHKKAEAFAKAKAHVINIANQVSSGKWPFDALIIDSLSALADNALQYIMSNSGQLNQQPQIQHWGLAFSEIKQIVAILRSLPIVVVLVAHEQIKTIGTGPTAETKLEIAIQGKNLPQQIARYFDEIFHIRAKPIGGGKFSYVIQTKSDDKIEARSRMQIPNHTDTSVGMWELIRLMGYVPPKREVKA